MTVMIFKERNVPLFTFGGGPEADLVMGAIFSGEAWGA